MLKPTCSFGMYDILEVTSLDLKNRSFAVTRPTQLWRCRLKILYWSSESKKKYFQLKIFPKVIDYFNVKFYFSNACLNSAERIYHFPQQKN